jgi:RsiW-degrading membrane proteinase PrsW (M82 family)
MPAPTPLWKTLVLALAAVLTMSCRGRLPLAGLHDAVIHLRAPEHGLPAEELDARIEQRLGAAEIAVDIDRSGPGGLDVDVRVERDLADEASRLLLWHGGVGVAIVDSRAGPSEVTRTGDALGRVEAALTGKEPDPPGRHHLAGRLGERDRARLRLLEWPPPLHVDTASAAARGPDVWIPLSEEALLSLASLRSHDPPPELVVTRDRIGLATLSPGAEGELTASIVDHSLVLHRGSDITAYSDAADLSRLLATPVLPKLTLVATGEAPPDVWLAVGNLFLPFAVSAAWLFFVRRFDRAQPEPLWLILATFGLGALAVIPAGFVEWAWDSLSPYANPTLLTFGGSPTALPIAFVGFVVTVGLTEEGAKLLATWSLATHRREFDEPVDGMVYAAAAALGFAAAENVHYLAVGRVAGALVASRAFMSVPSHLFFSTIWGYGLGRRLVAPKQRTWPLFLLAISLHGLFDACLSITGGALAAIAVALMVASVFVVHLQRALRYGAVPLPIEILAGAIPVEPRGERELFRMGSRWVFAGFVVLMYVCSATVFVLTLAGRHFGVALAVGSTVVFGLLGWAARGVAASLPLDVAVDDTGVTFAGAAIRYGDVVRVERQRVRGSPRRQERMIVFGQDRRLILGPASGETIDALSRALARRLTAVPPSPRPSA